MKSGEERAAHACIGGCVYNVRMGGGVVHSFSRAGSLGSGFYELSVSRVSKRRGRGGHVGRAFTGLASAG